MVRPGKDEARYLAETEDRPGGRPAVTRQPQGPAGLEAEAAALGGLQQRPFGQDRIRADVGDISAQGDGYNAAIASARAQRDLTEGYLGRGVPVRPPDGSTP